MNAIEEALGMMDGCDVGLAAAHTLTALRGGGFAVWLPEVVCVVVPWDPVGGDHAHTLAVLFAGGELGRLVEFAEGWLEQGFTDVVWCRGFKGREGLRKYDLGRWVQLCRAMVVR